MPNENEHQSIENEWNDTNNELLKLKKELAEEIVQKLQEKDSDILSTILEWNIADYLVDEDNTFLDVIHDGLLESSWLVSSTLKTFKDRIREVKNKEELDNLRTNIISEISENKSDWTSTPEQTDTQPSNPATTTAAVTTTTATVTTASTLWASSTNEKAKVDSSESYEIDHLNFTISPETKKIWENLKWKEKPDLEPFACAFKAYNLAKKQVNIPNTKYLTVVDFTKKKWKKRFFVINLENNTVEHAVKVWHWKNTGGERATEFSNKSWSKQSSLWWYLLPDKITKSPNKSRSWLRQIKWLEKSNDQSDERWIAVHPWWENGSEGCFTLPKDISKTIMEKIAWSFLFAYAESKEYFAYQSKYFKQNPDGSIMA